MNHKQTLAFLKAVQGTGEYAHLNTPAAQQLLGAMQGSEAPAAVAAKIVAAGNKRRGEV